MSKTKRNGLGTLVRGIFSRRNARFQRFHSSPTYIFQFKHCTRYDRLHYTDKNIITLPPSRNSALSCGVRRSCFPVDHWCPANTRIITNDTAKFDGVVCIAFDRNKAHCVTSRIDKIVNRLVALKKIIQPSKFKALPPPTLISMNLFARPQSLLLF